MPQIVYDNSGNLDIVILDDGTNIVPGGNGWSKYIAQYGAPPQTGTPTFPLPPMTQNQQNAIAALKAYAQTTPGASTGISAQQDAFNREVLVVLKLIGSQLN